MSDIAQTRNARLDVLRHRRMQAAALDLIAAVSDELGEPWPVPLDAATSLALQATLATHLRGLRTRAGQLVDTFTVKAVVDEVATHLTRLGPDVVTQHHAEGAPGGFFVGACSSVFLRAWLIAGNEGVVIVRPDLSAGLVLDTSDEPRRRARLEWW